MNTLNTTSNPVKKILIVQYSQSGQLTDIVSQICTPLEQDSAVELYTLNLQMESEFPFPWPFIRFFNIFPECVYLDPPALKPLAIDLTQKFDLVILAYQVWFLAPSLPISAFLQHPTARACLRDTPVITVIGCRNMWTRAQMTVQQLLAEAGAKLIDNVVLVDQGSALASFITTPRWVLTGKKNAFWGFPPAGVSEQDIRASARFGHAIAAGLHNDSEKSGQPLLSGLAAVTVDPALVQSEKVGYRSFRIWGRLLRLLGDQNSLLRKCVLIFYILFLVCLIVTVVPALILVRLSLKPLLKTRYNKLKAFYELPSGSGLDRMEKFRCQK